MMKKIKVGVLGAARGSEMIKYCKCADNAELVAICDKHLPTLEKHKKNIDDQNITFYDNFDDFIKHDMDAVVLANYATEHAPFAIRALKAGLHVYSEVLPCQTMKEAVELVETVEETGLVYAFGENYCYMNGPYEMKKLYEQGKLGEFEYGEGEYIHNCEHAWPYLTYGDKNHWRNNTFSTFYCTHSIGPIIHITGLRPVSVIGIEGTKTERNLRMGLKAGAYGIEMITLENGGVIKSIHGGLYQCSVWFSIYGSKGRMEVRRHDANREYLLQDGSRNYNYIYVDCDEYSGEYGGSKLESYYPVPELWDKAKEYAHGGSDFYSMYYFIERIKGDKTADIIDVYEAMDMFLPGLFAYFSILDGSKPKEIPNLRNKEERDLWRNNTACTDPKVAGDMLLPTSVNGTPDIDDSVYEKAKKIWDEALENK